MSQAQNSKIYLHFTDSNGVEGIKKTGTLWASSFGPVNSVFAIVQGGAWVPGVQMTTMGRAKTRSFVIVFETKILPDYSVEEETVWHLASIPVRILDVISPNEAKTMLNDSMPVDGEVGMHEMPLHLSFNNMGDWERMPKDFSPWTPGIDTEKYFEARKIWLKTKNLEMLKNFWDNNTKTNNLIETIIKTITLEMVSKNAW